MKKQSSFDILTGLAMVGQLGITLIVPLLLFVFLGVWLQERFSLGVWVIIVSILIGLISAGCSFFHFMRAMLMRMKMRDEQESSPLITTPLSPKNSDNSEHRKEDNHEDR